MAGGAGHIYDMISRMRNNSNLLSKPGYFKMKEAYLKVSNKEKLVYHKASVEELQRIRRKVIAEKQAELIRLMVVAIASVGIAAVLISAVVYAAVNYLM